MTKTREKNARAYLVEEDGKPVRIVEAISQAEVLRHVTRDRIHIRVANQKDFLSCLKAGVEVETVEPNKETDNAEE